MKCRRARKLLFGFSDGIIDESDRIALEEHLVECQSCASEASSLARSLDLLHRLPQESPSENFNWKVRLQISREKNALHRQLGTERAWLKSWNIRFAASAVSAFVLALTAGYFLVRPAVMESLRPAGWVAERAGTPDGSGDVAGRSIDRARGNPPSRAGAVDPTPVSYGNYGDPGRAQAGPIEESLDGSPYLVLDPDTLVFLHVESKLLKVRVRSLQQQVEQLQRELRGCERSRR